MNKLDLRQVGTFMGLPLYIDLDSIPDFREEGDLMTERDKKQLRIAKMLRDALAGEGEQ